MNNRNLTLIGKYALCLAIFYVLEYGISRVMQEAGVFESLSDRLWTIYIPSILMLALNVVTALLINLDRKKHNIYTRYVIIATLLYRPIGVCAFLLFSIYDNHKDPISI